MKYRDIVGQLTLMDFVAMAEAEPQKPVRKGRKKAAALKAAPSKLEPSIEEDAPEDYLKRAVYLESLAKERYTKAMQGLEMSDYQQKFYAAEIHPADTFNGVVEDCVKVMRKFLRDEKDYAEDGELMKFLHAEIDNEFSLFPINAALNQAEGEKPWHFVLVRESGAYRYLKYHKRKTDDCLGLVFKEAGEEQVVVGYRAYNHTGRTGTDTIWTRDCVHGFDIARMLVILILFTQYKRLLVNNREKVTGILREEKADELRQVATERQLLTTIEENSLSYLYGTHYTVLRPSWDECGDTVERRLKAEPGACFMMPLAERDRPSEAFQKWFKAKYHVPELLVMSPTRADKTGRPDRWYIRENSKAVEKNLPIPYYILTREAEVTVAGYNPYEALDGFGKVLSEGDCWNYVNGTLNWEHFLAPHLPFRASWDMGKVLVSLFHEKKAAVESLRYYKELSGGVKAHAKSYQTKRGIPEKVIKAMKESLFNKYFSYVEFDEMSDIEKAEDVAKEFIAIKETYFKSLDLKGAQVRFRRLGNHKASGLYYPSLNCLCVDVGCVRSFIHEFGHLIDFVSGDGVLSERDDFYQLWNIYCDALDDYLKKNKESEAAKRLSGGSKYNLSYYKVKTEAFARCFEIYCTEYLGIKNALCNPDERDAFAYPTEDKVVMSFIREYFDKLMERLNAEPEPEEEISKAA